MNSERLIKKMADCSVVVKCINNIRYILAHINLSVPISGKKLGSSVYKVCCEDLRNYALFIGLVHLIKSVTEKTKGCECEDSARSLFL